MKHAPDLATAWLIPVVAETWDGYLNDINGHHVTEEVFFSLPPGAGSVIAVVGTEAPLLLDQCRALARRVTLGLARTGTSGSHLSRDLFLALSNGNPGAITPDSRPSSRKRPL